MKNSILRRSGLEELAAYASAPTTAVPSETIVIPEPVETEVTVVDLPVVVATDDAVQVVDIPVAAVVEDGEVVSVAVATDEQVQAEAAPETVEVAEVVIEVDPDTEAVVTVSASVENETQASSTVVITPVELTEIPSTTEAPSTTAPVVELDVAVALPVEEAPLVVAPVVSETLAIDVPAVMLDTEVEYQEIVVDVDNSSDAVDVLQEVAAALEKLASSEPDAVIDPDERVVIEIAIASATAVIDEEFSESISIENLGQKAKEVFKAIVAAIKAAFAKIGEFFVALKNKISSNSAKVKEAKDLASKASKVVIKVSRIPTGGKVISNDGAQINLSARLLKDAFTRKSLALLLEGIDAIESTGKHHADVISSINKISAQIKSGQDTSVTYKELESAVEAIVNNKASNAVVAKLSEEVADAEEYDSSKFVALVNLLTQYNSAVEKIADKHLDYCRKEQDAINNLFRTVEGADDKVVNVARNVSRNLSTARSVMNLRALQSFADSQANTASAIARKIATIAAKQG